MQFKSCNSTVCILMTELEFAIHSICELGISFFFFGGGGITSHSFFGTIANSVPHHPDKKCNFTCFVYV